MDDYPSNSRITRPPARPATKPTTVTPSTDEERKYESVITGEAKRRKKSLGRRFLDTFFKADSGSVLGYLLKDVLVPALQDIVINTVTQGIEKAVTGEVRNPGRAASSYRGSSSRGTHVSYDRPGLVRPATSTRRPTTQPSSMDIDEIVLDTQHDAQTVANQLYDELRVYNLVTVAALYGFIGETPTYLDSKFGWDDLDGLDIQRLRNGAGWVLQLPRPIDLRQ